MPKSKCLCPIQLSKSSPTPVPNPAESPQSPGRLPLSDLPHLLTVPEAAALLRLTPKGVYALVEARRIPFVRVSNRVRFFREEVLSWLQENRVPAKER